MIVLYQAPRSFLFIIIIIIILLHCIMSSAQYLRFRINLSVHGYVLVDASYLLSSSLFCLTYTPYVRSCNVDVASTIHADHLLVFIGNIFITFNKKLENIVLIMGCIVKHSTRMTYFY